MFWCEHLGKGFRHSMSRKIQAAHEILIGPVGQFQSVTKGVQIAQRGFLDARKRKNATRACVCEVVCFVCILCLYVWLFIVIINSYAYLTTVA